MRTPEHLRNRDAVRKQIGGQVPRERCTTRLNFLNSSIDIWGWPSRGGLIVLERVGSVEFDYLGLDRFQLELKRSSSQDNEDAFCQMLLRLGARWFDSRARYGLVSDVADGIEYQNQKVEDGEQPVPSMMERRWVCVGIEENGFWVLEHDRIMFLAQEMNNLVPSDAAKVILAKTMEERCEIIKSMGATFYRELSDYRGSACLNAWAQKTTGEFGPLVVAPYIGQNQASTST